MRRRLSGLKARLPAAEPERWRVMAEPQRGRVPVTLLAAIVATAGMGCARGRASDDPRRGGKPVKARVVPVVARTIQRTVEAVGSLFPFEEVTVGSEVEGRFDEGYVDVGDRVTRGRPLVKIVPVELSLTLEQERAALRQIEARLAPSEGGGELKSTTDAAEVKKAEADRTDATQKYQRAQELLAQGLVARDSFDEAEARYHGAQAAYDMAVQNVQNLRAQAAQHTASVEIGRASGRERG